MAIGAGNAMGAFEAGVAGGKVGSPAYGVGNAIRGMLDQARKKGLMQEQAQGNLMSSMGSSIMKQEQANRKTTTSLYDAEGNFLKDLSHLEGNKPIVQNAMSFEERLNKLDFDDEMKGRAEDAAKAAAGGGGGDTGLIGKVPERPRVVGNVERANTSPLGGFSGGAQVGGDLSSKAAAFLESNGAVVSEANINAVIQKGLVQ